MSDAQQLSVVRDSCADGDKFVAAQPRQQVNLADAAAKGCGYVLQGRITGGMTEAVINRLEPIEINLQDPKTGPGGRIASKSGFNECVVFVSICQAGQAVVLRHERQRTGRFAQSVFLIGLFGYITA